MSGDVVPTNLDLLPRRNPVVPEFEARRFGHPSSRVPLSHRLLSHDQYSIDLREKEGLTRFALEIQTIVPGVVVVASKTTLPTFWGLM